MWIQPTCALKGAQESGKRGGVRQTYASTPYYLSSKHTNLKAHLKD
jgi:hypothetical protein